MPMEWEQFHAYRVNDSGRAPVVSKNWVNRPVKRKRGGLDLVRVGDYCQYLYEPEGRAITPATL